MARIGSEFVPLPFSEGLGVRARVCAPKRLRALNIYQPNPTRDAPLLPKKLAHTNLAMLAKTAASVGTHPHPLPEREGIFSGSFLSVFAPSRESNLKLSIGRTVSICLTRSREGAKAARL